MSGYQIYEDDYAVLIAKSALLVAEVEAMKQANESRRQAGETDAYSEVDFYKVSDDLRNQLERCRRKDES